MSLDKIVGTGNDFLFIDDREQRVDRTRRPHLARIACDRHFGIGADGLVFVEEGESGAQLRWDFYNNDGSTAEMCGNASRCMGRWAQLRLGLNSITLDTRAGRLRVEAKGEQFASHLDYLKIAFKQLKFSLKGHEFMATFANTGVPHAVYEIPAATGSPQDGGAARFASEIAALRFHPETGERGTNVTFLQREGDDFKTVTFERGVEDYTLSCGTGVLAAAAVGLRETNRRSAVVTAPGGKLEVRFGQAWDGVVLTGPADYLFTVELTGRLAREFEETR